MNKKLTDAELLLLGLVAEMPRHGYHLEQIIDERGMRDWTPIGFSSIYFVLNKLQKYGYVTAQKSQGSKAKKTFSITPDGKSKLAKQSLEALRHIRPNNSTLNLGMLHLPFLKREQIFEALSARGIEVSNEISRLEAVRYARQPLPDYAEALFDFSTDQLRAEHKWLRETTDYFETKVWDDQ